jgi:hypothetical protein
LNQANALGKDTNNQPVVNETKLCDTPLENGWIANVDNSKNPPNPADKGAKGDLLADIANPRTWETAQQEIARAYHESGAQLGIPMNSATLGKEALAEQLQARIESCQDPIVEKTALGHLLNRVNSQDEVDHTPAQILADVADPTGFERLQYIGNVWRDLSDNFGEQFRGEGSRPSYDKCLQVMRQHLHDATIQNGIHPETKAKIDEIIAHLEKEKPDMPFENKFGVFWKTAPHQQNDSYTTKNPETQAREQVAEEFRYLAEKASKDIGKKYSDDPVEFEKIIEKMSNDYENSNSPLRGEKLNSLAHLKDTLATQDGADRPVVETLRLHADASAAFNEKVFALRKVGDIPEGMLVYREGEGYRVKNSDGSFMNEMATKEHLAKRLELAHERIKATDPERAAQLELAIKDLRHPPEVGESPHLPGKEGKRGMALAIGVLVDFALSLL